MLNHWIFFETLKRISPAQAPRANTTNLNVKDVLRSRLLEKKTSSSAEVTAKEDRLELLEKWHRDQKSAGFSVDLTSLTAKHSPFEDVDPTTIPDCVLMLYPSDIHTFHVQTGPFQLVRLVIHGDGAWSLHCPIFEHTVINSGKLLTLETSRVTELAQEILHGKHTLSPGILKDFSFLGYVPENMSHWWAYKQCSFKKLQDLAYSQQEYSVEKRFRSSIKKSLH